VKFPILFYIFLFIQCSAAIVGGFRYRSLPRPLRILEWLIIIGVVDSSIQWFLASFHIYNLWTMHFYTLIELIFLIMIYSFWIKQHRSRSILIFCLAGFVILWIVSKFSFETFSQADDLTSGVSKILLIMFSGYLLVDVVKESDIVWINDPRFWVATGTIIYSAATLFLFASFTKMLQISTEHFLMLWPFNWIFLIISYSLYARSFLCKS
jgi:hypothetical protein